MAMRHRPNFKEALSTLRRLEKAEDQAYYPNWWQALPRLGDNGKIPVGIPHLRHHRDDGLNTDGAREPSKTVNGLFFREMSLTMNLVQNYSDQFGNSPRSLLSPTGCVKSIPPTTENWLRKPHVLNDCFWARVGCVSRLVTVRDGCRDLRYTCR